MKRNHFARECCQRPGISMRAMQARLLWEALGPPGPRHDANKHREQAFRLAWSLPCAAGHAWWIFRLEVWHFARADCARYERRWGRM